MTFQQMWQCRCLLFGPLIRSVSRAGLSGLVAILLVTSNALAQADPLPSWNDTPTKQAIVAFVAKVTQAGGLDFVPESERVAVFDIDGTLVPERLFPSRSFRCSSTSRRPWRGTHCSATSPQSRRFSRVTMRPCTPPASRASMISSRRRRDGRTTEDIVRNVGPTHELRHRIQS